ncbi:MAG: serine/threonine protein kinase [Anaerolineae bacterium]|jgi:predicted Ser/Thr protein kinase|nr:serine/threonine protein kinase [Anaerolineae bacterium]
MTAPLSSTFITRSRINSPSLQRAMQVIWFIFTTFYVIYTTLSLEPLYNQRMEGLMSGLENFSAAGLTPQFYLGFLTVMPYVVILSAYAVAVFIVWRRSDDWYVMALGFTMVATATFGFGLNAPAWMSFISLSSLIVIGYLFPDGRFGPQWTRYAAPLVVLWAAIAQSQVMLPPNTGVLLVTLTVVTISFVVAHLQRYRAASPPQRRQIRLVMVMFVLLITLMALNNAIFALLAVLQIDPLHPMRLYHNLTSSLILGITGVGLQVSLAIAVLRYKLYNIDFVLNRSLLYGGVTVILSLFFAIGFLIVQQVFQQSQLALALAVAVIIGLFQPTRNALQHLIDRRFFLLRFDLNQLEQRQRAENETPNQVFTGQAFGVYEIGKMIGKGGMGAVYRGRQISLNRQVAIKILSPELAQRPEYLKRFQREARIVASLRHPNIVGLYDYGNLNGAYFLVMEYTDGKELGSFLKAQGCLPLHTVRWIVRDIASALDYAHEQGLVHRDIKPSNIMLQTTVVRQEAILMDFGIVKVDDEEETDLTHTSLIGTIDYSAPEQIQSGMPIDARADIYSLGVMTYHMITGELPFKGNVGQILFAHLYKPVPDPRLIRPDTPEAVVKAIHKAMAKNPHDRFATAGEFSQALLES